MYVVTLNYHQIAAPSDTLRKTLFEQHLCSLKNAFPFVLPGDTLQYPLSVCLTFDDAYADFYGVVFPILKKWNIPALVAVPTQYIEAHTQVDMEIRCKAPPFETMTSEYAAQVPFCTWAELKEIIESGLVQVASHSHSHPVISEVNYQAELVMANQLLQEHLCIKPNNFIYPYGRFNPAVHQKVRQMHRYVHRIGNALNRGWEGSVLYRVDANRFWLHQKPITQADIRGLFWRYWWNRVRRK